MNIFSSWGVEELDADSEFLVPEGWMGLEVADS